MLPDFPVAKEARRKQIAHFLDKKIKEYSGGLLNEIPKRIVHEGNSILTEYEDGIQDSSAMTAIKVQSSLEDIEVLIKQPSRVFELLDEMARDMAAQQCKLIFEKISDVTEMVGNVVKTQGKLTPEYLFEMYKKIELEFNPDGTPRMPTILEFGNSKAKEFAEVINTIHGNPSLYQRFLEIIEHQKQRWYDRAANRKLVD